MAAEADQWGDDGIVPLICPTCQNVFRGIARSIGHVVTLHGVVFDILVGSAARPAFARWASAQQPSLRKVLAWPKLAKPAKAGGPGRTRTCNQTVMSGRL
jgi:hypothetical protein